jgi:predicted nucleic acid-binding protein
MQVFDSHAVFVYLEKEPGHEKVAGALTHAARSGKKILLTTVNWGEIYYITLREMGETAAEAVLSLLSTLPLEIVNVDSRLAKQAGFYKAHKKMSYADCFAAALAKLTKSDLLTGDREFREVDKEIRIVWL